MALLGVDVSHYQSGASSPAWWTAARAAGVIFGFAKATQGVGYRDPTFAANTAAMRASGVLPGAYHFIEAGDGAGQADVFTAAVGQVNGGTVAGMLCALDAESGGWSDVQAFAARWRARTPHPLIIYTGAWFWVGVIGNPNGSGLGPLWHSRYPGANPGSPKTQWDALGGAARAGGFTPGYGGWVKALIWQFSHNARIGTTTCDANAFDGDPTQLAALAGTDIGGISVADAASIEQQVAYVQAQVKSTAQLVVDGDNALLAKITALAAVAAGVAPPIDIDALAAKIIAGLPAGTVFEPAVVEAAVRKVLVEGTGGSA